MRLDQYMVENGFVDSRTKAQTLIKSEKVSVAGKTITKPAFKVFSEEVKLTDEKIYVSRAAKKLKDFLPLLPFQVTGMSALDIGASTGGFTEILLEAGAESVTCVDVGSGQLHPSLVNDRRVINFEKMDIRNYPTQKQFELITSDVSFISLHHIFEAIDALSSRYIILLFKPQFEVGKDVKRDSNGVVVDKKAIALSQTKFEESTAALGWKLLVQAPASISGKEGNQEECYCFEKC